MGFAFVQKQKHVLLAFYLVVQFLIMSYHFWWNVMFFLFSFKYDGQKVGLKTILLHSLLLLMRTELSDIFLVEWKFVMLEVCYDFSKSASIFWDCFVCANSVTIFNCNSAIILRTKLHISRDKKLPKLASWFIMLLLSHGCLNSLHWISWIVCEVWSKLMPAGQYRMWPARLLFRSKLPMGHEAPNYYQTAMQSFNYFEPRPLWCAGPYYAQFVAGGAQVPDPTRQAETTSRIMTPYRKRLAGSSWPRSCVAAN